MNKKLKTKVKRTLATTVATTLLLSSGLPLFTPTAEASYESLPTLPSIPMLSNNVTETVIDGEYIVTFKEGTTTEQMKQIIEQYSGKMIDGEYSTNIIGLKLTNRQYEQMKQDPLVEIIEQNQEVAVSSYGQLKQYSHDITNVPSAWESGFTGKGVQIAILDTGIFPHSDLNLAGGVSTVNYTNSYYDDNGHGTHVAGVIASLDNGVGTTGVASDATIYSVKVLNHTGKGSLIDIVEGMDWAIQKGVDIINVSLGTYTDSASLKAKVDEAVSKGIIVVAATGNSGDSNVMYPAKFDNVVAVGATDQYNNLASFSTYGPEVDVVAPGVGIASTYLGNIFAQGNGTSQAAPYVAGMLALLSEQYPEKSANEITQMLYSNTLDLGPTGKDSKFGHGLVQYPSPVKEEEPVVEEEPIQEEPVQEEEQPVVEEDSKEEVKEEPKQETETPTEEVIFELPEGIEFDALSEKLSWKPFENASRYRVTIDEKQADGSYEQYRYPQAVTKTEYDLSRARLDNNEEYKISIIPRVGITYEEGKAVELFATSKGNTLIVSGQRDSIKEEPKTEVKSPIKETTEPKNENLELPEGITLDEDKENIIWEDFAGADRYRVVMETIDSNGNLQDYNIPRTVTKPEFKLSYLRDKGNYKLSIIPRIGFSYVEEQAKELFVSTLGEEVVIAAKADSINAKTPSPSTNVNVKQEIEVVNKVLPKGITFDNKKQMINWEPFANANRYRVAIDVKQPNGSYASYRYPQAISKTEYDLSRLDNNEEYKISIIPRIGVKYDEEQALELYVSTKSGNIEFISEK